MSAASVMHQAWAQVLSRVCGKADVVFGTVLFGRMQGGADADRVPGLFINTLPLRVSVDERGVADVVRATHAQLAALLRHEHAPLSLAQRCSGVAAPLPLFSSLLNYRHSVAVDATPNWAGVQILGTAEYSNYPVNLSIDDTGTGFTLSAQVTDAVAALRVCRYMQVALADLVRVLEDAPESPLSSVEILPLAEREQLLYGFNATATEVLGIGCLHELFERQVARTPDASALVHAGQSLSYAELNAQANRLACYLREQGVGPERLVAICTERSVEMVVGVLATLKAGGAYVPLDPAYPRERLAYMLQDSAPVLMLTYGEGAAATHGLAEAVARIDLGRDTALWMERMTGNQPVFDAASLAYVIYTSGSTGLPKGVMVQHDNVVNAVLDYSRSSGLHAGDRILQFASFGFDTSVVEIFPGLSVGAEIVLRPLDMLVPDATFFSFLRTHRITVADLPTAFWHAWAGDASTDLPQCSSELRRIVVGGEKAELLHLVQWFAKCNTRDIDWTNMYGPTETTINATAITYDANSILPVVAIPIGRPIANTQVYVLDARLKPVPIGSVGELYIGGAGVARGYLNRPELTAERFIADPFSNETGARLYKTGDLGRWLADGSIEYLGRNDFQVKIRGFRIELGEIETCLVGCAGVREAVVLAREDAPGDQRLVAYLVPEEGAELDLAVVRAALAAQLAAFMVPSAFVLLTRLPLTPNGKLDRKALPVPSGDAYASEAYETPQGEVEEKLAAIWAELLQVERVGRQDDFFALGGHSLLAVRLVSRVRQVLGQELALGALFANPVLAQLAQGLDGTAARALPGLKPVPRGGPLALSFAQQRLWFLAQMEGVSQAYHIPGAVRLTGALDRVALERTLDRIVARHEALRTRFVEQDGAVYQVVDGAQIGLTLAMHDLRGDDDAPGRLRALNQAQAVALFDLEAGPLIRASLVCMGEQEHVLLMTMHHIVSDGWSMGVLLNEVSALYGAYVQGRADPLPTLAIQYPDYASWQRGRLDAVELAQHNAYWKQALAGAPALLALPTDRPRPLQQDYVGARLELALEGPLVQQLKQLSQRHGVTLYMTLLAGWAALLARLAGQDEVVVGTPVAGRSHAELEPLIGLFVNTLALRIDVSAQPTVAQLLAQVKQQVLAGQQHQDLPFEQVVELLQPARSLAHAPLFQTMFAWQNTPSGTLDLPGLQLSNIDGAAAVTAKFDLTLSLQEAGGGIAGGIEYACALFDAATVERYAGYWRRLLAEMVTDSGRGVAALPLLEDAERQQLLYGFNATAADYPRDACLHELFEQQVARTPDATALVYEDQALSYAQLNERANRLAHYLRTQGVGPDRLVGICAERGLDMMIGLLATLKAGGAYVPLDPAYPSERLAYIVNEAKLTVLLTQHNLRSLLPNEAVPVLCLDSDWTLVEENPVVNQSCLTHAGNLAYVIYTSGSTGNPKGVMVEHRCVVNFWAVMQASTHKRCPQPSRIGLNASFSFDMSLKGILQLLSGHCLYPVPQVLRADGEQLLAFYAAYQIHAFDSTPSQLELLLEAGLLTPGGTRQLASC
ncbi:amino acid adenylation domain-containing protein [Janthinobacterium lividum]|nr:amino acid adenylation domain-containing protein [Janthinobacterium lividum]